MTDREWVAAFAAELGVDPPDDEAIDRILRLAAVAAHASERTAAPVACWLAGTTGRPLDELLPAAERVTGDPDG